MNTFKQFHPTVLLLYFVSVLSVSMFCFNPVLLVFAVLGAALYTAVTDGLRGTIKSIMSSLIIVLIVSVTNPIFSHNGATAILFINDNRITLEALIYGFVLGLAIAAALLWLRCFRVIFDSEKILFLFGKLSPKIALVISMSLNFVPGFIRHFKSVNMAQKSLPMSRLRRYIYSFSAVVSRSLEDAIITSDSMRARGYGRGKRTCFSRYRFTPDDLARLCLIIALTAACALPMALGQLSFSYYPLFRFPELNLSVIVSFMAFAMLSLLPFFHEIKEDIRWKYSISKI